MATEEDVLALLDEMMGLCYCQDFRQDKHDVNPPCDRRKEARRIVALFGKEDTPKIAAKPFDGATAVLVGLTREGNPNSARMGAVRYRIPNSPYYVYDAEREDYPWGYAHVEDGYDYGQVENLALALVAAGQSMVRDDE